MENSNLLLKDSFQTKQQLINWEDSPLKRGKKRVLIHVLFCLSRPINTSIATSRNMLGMLLLQLKHFALNFTNIKHRNFDLISSDWNNLCIFETGSTCKRGADKLCNDITSYPGLLLTKVSPRLLTSSDRLNSVWSSCLQHYNGNRLYLDIVWSHFCLHVARLEKWWVQKITLILLFDFVRMYPIWPVFLNVRHYRGVHYDVV